MTRRIYRSILTAACAVMLSCVSIIMGCLYDYFGIVQEGQLEDALALAVTGVETSGAAYLSALPEGTYRLTWIAADGAVLYDAQADEQTMENHAAREEVRAAMEEGYGRSERYSDTLLQKTVYCAQRLKDGSVLRISVSRVTIGVLVLGMFHPIAAVAFATLALTFLLARRLAARIVEPLDRLDLEHPLENKTYEELTPLLRRLHRQRRQIDAQMTQLRQKKDEFAQIIASMSEGLILLNESGTILSINPAAGVLLRAREESVGRDISEVARGELTEVIARAVATGHGETRMECDAREYQVDVSRIESAGKVIGAVVLAFDVTAQTEAERSRREFTANVSHELKTPLTSILGSAELIENGLVKAEDLPRFAGHIHAEAQRLLTLIEDIIRLSQLDEGVELPNEVVDLEAAVRETAEQLRLAAEKKQVRIETHTQPCAVRGAARLVHEIVYNLTENAIKYNVDGGLVTLTAEETAEGARLCVADTGIGIPREQLSRVFERFYRVDKSHSKASGGTGLGLSIVKHAAAYCGAEIHLESECGRGTTVTVEFPRAADTEKQGALRAMPAPTLDK